MLGDHPLRGHDPGGDLQARSSAAPSQARMGYCF